MLITWAAAGAHPGEGSDVLYCGAHLFAIVSGQPPDTAGDAVLGALRHHDHDLADEDMALAADGIIRDCRVALAGPDARAALTVLVFAGDRMAWSTSDGTPPSC